MPQIPRSNISMVGWPAIPDHAGGVFLALMHQFEQSERLPAAELEELQFRTLRTVLAHACETVPFYRDRPGYRELLEAGPLDAAAWRRLPVLTRVDLQDAGRGVVSEATPSDHHPLTESLTSGSTGRPVRTVSTRITSVFWHAITLREHIWHDRDGTLKLASIRAEGSDKIAPGGVTASNWGSAVEAVFPHGPAVMLGINHDIAFQARWLASESPHYLLSLPSNLVALARHFLAEGARLPNLRGVIAYGEMAGPDVRAACQEAWGVGVSDIYSSQEVGYIAIQCPEAGGLHVQSESVYVEVLDDDDQPCPPGEVGRIVVSGLHNFAMPLLRYEVGDYAEVGVPCPCGRSLPVLERVVGRRRNMLRLPTGELMWPRLPAHQWSPAAPSIRQLQVVQDEIDHLEARIVGTRPLTEQEEAAFTAVLQRLLRHPFRIDLTYLDGIDRTRERKFDDFVSRL